jgi:hypothetical protein
MVQIVLSHLARYTDRNEWIGFEDIREALTAAFNVGIQEKVE